MKLLTFYNVIVALFQLYLLTSLGESASAIPKINPQPTDPPLTTTTSPPTTQPTTPSTTTTTNGTTTTHKPEPPPTTTTQIPTTIPTTSSTTTTPSPPTTSTTTVKPTVSPTSKPEPDRKFDGPSFIGGIVFTLGLTVIGFISWKFYQARTGPNYHIL